MLCGAWFGSRAPADSQGEGAPAFTLRFSSVEPAIRLEPMLSFSRLSRLIGYVLSLPWAWLPSGAVHAQIVVGAPAAVTAEAVAPPASRWFHGGTLRTVFGYTDNVLWSAVAPQRRGFAQTELEAFLLRAPGSRWEAKALLSGEVRRYFSAIPEATGEQSWLSRGEIAVTPVRRLRFSVVPQVYYMDQVYDLSADRDRPFVAKMRVRGAAGSVQARLALSRRWEFESMAQRRVTDYRDFPEDFSENRIGVRLRWRAREQFEIGLASHQHRRSYRDRVNYTAGGRALPDTKLRFEQTTTELNVMRTWSWLGTWSVAPALEYLENRDGASGFFDYDLRRARLDLSWRVERWRVEIETAAGRYDYRVQTVGMGLAPPKRLREDFTAALGLEYAIGQAWKVVARYSWERARTNEVAASYRINAASAGVAWSY